MFNNKLIMEVAIGLAVGGIFVGCYKLYNDYKAYMERQIQIIANGIEINVDKEIVDRAIADRINKIVKREIDSECIKAVTEIRYDIRSEVKDSISHAYSDLKGDVEKEMERQLGNIDISDVRKEVVRKAKERTAEKFDSDLKEVLDTYNRDLENISKIYSSIASKLDTTAQKEKSVNLNIG